MHGRRTILVASVLMLSRAAAAQEPTSPEYVEARQRLQEGKALYGQGNIDGARLKFEQACAVLKTPACLRALGLAQFYTRRYLEALANLQRALEDPELDTVQRKQVTDLRQQAFDKTGHLEIRAPAGAHVRIDDTVDAGNAPLREVVNVTIGSHTISVQVEDHTERKTIECAEGKVVKVDFGGAQSTSTGGSGTAEQHPTVETRAQFFPPPTGAIVLGVLGLVGIGTGIGFGVASGSANDTNTKAGLTANGICSAQPANPLCVSAESTRSSQGTDAVAATVAYVAGGALLVTAVVWWLVAPRRVQEHQVTWTPTVGPRSAGMALRCSF